MLKTKHENQIDYVELPTKDTARTKAFYTSVFGWKFEDYGPEYTSFFDGRLAGGFTTQGSVSANGLLLVIFSSDLESTQKRIRKSGGKIVKETYSFPGGKRFHFADPDGNELAVWCDE